MQSTKVKRFTHMTPNEKRENMREKKKESRCKLSRQKKDSLQTKQNNQRQKARTTAGNNTDDDQTSQNLRKALLRSFRFGSQELHRENRQRKRE